MPPRRLAADATLPPFFRSSDVFHSSQTEDPLIENVCRHVNESHNVHQGSILTLIIAGSGYPDVWPQTSPFLPSSGALMSSTIHKQRLLQSETAVRMLVKAKMSVSNVLTVMFTRSGHHYVWPQT